MHTASRIRQIEAAALHACLIFTLVLCLAGTSAALEFVGKFPSGPYVGETTPLAVGGDGSIYFHDPGSTGFLKILPDGTKAVQLQAEAGSFNVIALAADGDIYVGSKSTYTMSRFHPDGTLVRTWGSEGSGQGQFMKGPSAMTIAPTGSVYVGDWVFTDRVNRLGGRIQEFTLNGDYVGQWLMEVMPIALAVGPDGDVYANTGDHIYRYTTAGELVGSFKFSDTAPDITTTNGLVVADDGSVYVGANLCGIHHFGADGAYLETLGVCGDGDGEFSHPAYFARQADGTLVIFDDNNKITLMGTDGTVQHCYGNVGAGALQLHSPGDLAFTNSGELLVADQGNRRVKRYDGRGNYLGQWGEQTSGGALFGDIMGLTVGPDGRIYTASGTRKIQQLQPDGTLTHSWGEQGFSHGLLMTPTDILVTPDNIVLVADLTNGVVLRFQPDGTWLNSPRVPSPRAIARTPDGNYVIGTSASIFIFDGSFSEIIRRWTTGFTIRGLAVAEDGTIFVSDTDGSRIVRYTATGELLEATGSEGFGDGQFMGITHIAVKGNMVYAVDSTAGRVQYFHFSLRNRAGTAPLMLLLE